LLKATGFSRKVIVQDIAILRAFSGYEIIATPQGIYVPSAYQQRVSQVMAVKHSQEQIEDELMTIVILGGKVG